MLELDSPVAFAVVAMLAWGVWAALADVATRNVSPEVAMIVSYGTGAAIALGYVATRPETVAFTRTGLAWAGVAGLFAGVGAVAFYAGLSNGRTGVVTTISALYFIVAALIGVLVFDEPLGMREVAGVGFAVVAVVLLAK